MSPDRGDPVPAEPGKDRPDHLGAPAPCGVFATPWVRAALVGILLVVPPTQTTGAAERVSPAAVIVAAPGSGTPPAATTDGAALTTPATRSRGEPATQSRGQVAAPLRRDTVAQARGEKKEEPSAGGYWVQVGAFRDPRMAAALAEKLRAEKFRVQESTVAHGPSESPGRHRDDGAPIGGEGAEKYEVFVPGLSAADLMAKVASRGLSASAAAGGAVVRPGLALRDAVALSKDLTSQGLMVQVRRLAGDSAEDRRARMPEGAGAAGTLHRVRVGSFPDRATAEEARRELGARGYAGFLTREGG